MISLKKAKQIIFAKTAPLNKVEQAGFLDSLHRVLAQDLKATSDLPPFSRSTVDGFAVKSADIKTASRQNGVSLKIIGVIQAGKPSTKTLQKGQAVKIMTGAVLPKGADCVVMKEFAKTEGGQVLVFKNFRKKHGISFKGESAKKGTVLLKKGTKATAGVVSLLATLGF